MESLHIHGCLYSITSWRPEKCQIHGVRFPHFSWSDINLIMLSRIIRKISNCISNFHINYNKLLYFASSTALPFQSPYVSWLSSEEARCEEHDMTNDRHTSSALATDRRSARSEWHSSITIWSGWSSRCKCRVYDFTHHLHWHSKLAWILAFPVLATSFQGPNVIDCVHHLEIPIVAENSAPAKLTLNCVQHPKRSVIIWNVSAIPQSSDWSTELRARRSQFEL